MRLLIHLCNQRLLTYHIEHMWPMSKKIKKKQIPTNKIIIQYVSTIEDYGWPRSNKFVLKQRNKSKQETVSPP